MAGEEYFQGSAPHWTYVYPSVQADISLTREEYTSFVMSVACLDAVTRLLNEGYLDDESLLNAIRVLVNDQDVSS